MHRRQFFLELFFSIGGNESMVGNVVRFTFSLSSIIHSLDDSFFELIFDDAVREEKIYCCLVILLSLIKIWKANVGILYSLVLTPLNRKQPVDLLSVNSFVKS